LLSFDTLSIFGGMSSLDAEPEKGTKEDRDKGTMAREGDNRKLPNWGQIKEKSLDTLTRSKDLRVLAHLSAALLRTDGLPAFASTLTVASRWLESHWDEVHPSLADNERLSAINCFGDSRAIIEGLRRAPLTSSRHHARVTLRALDILEGRAISRAGEPKISSGEVAAAFAEMPLDDLEWMATTVTGAIEGVASIERRMREASGNGAPSIDLLSKDLTRVERLVRTELARRSPSAADGKLGVASPEPMANVVAPAGPVVGAIGSREDAVRALEAVAEYFHRHEPSSPIPLLVERAARLVSKSFLDVLADIAPNAVGDARAVGGLKKDP
jgi:type VI secretion system protein ImpA